MLHLLCITFYWPCKVYRDRHIKIINNDQEQCVGYFWKPSHFLFFTSVSSFTLRSHCLGIMSFSLGGRLKSHSRVLLNDFRHHSVDTLRALHIWQHFMRKVWTLTVTVHGPCLWQVCCSAKTLESPPFISRTPNSWRFLQKGQRFPLLSYISPFSTHMSILCQRIRVASYCSAAWEWCQLSYRAFSVRCKTAKQLTIPAKKPTHHIIYKTTSLLLRSVSRTLETYRRGRVGEAGVGG